MVWLLIRYPLAQLKYTIWKLKHPGQSFREFYAENAVTALEKGHNSLGPHLKPGRQEKARRTFNNLVSRGISPDDTFVDYGCGTLRVGALLIEFLEADRYIGLDIDKRILSAGIAQLAPELISRKRPVLEVISPESLSRVAARQPRWVCSNGVLQHVPPAELNEYFSNLSILIHAGAIGFLKAPLGPNTKQVAPKGWVHDFTQLRTIAEKHDMQLDMQLAKPGSKETLILRSAGRDAREVVPVSETGG